MKLIDGLRCRLRNLPRLLVWVKRMCSPSYSNHIGLTWTVSSGRIVPSEAKSGRSRSGRRFSGIVTRRESRPRPSAKLGAMLQRPVATVIGLVGGTGDLARRMVIPGCFHLMVAGLLPEQCRIVGLSLDDLDDDGFKDLVRHSLEEHARVDLSDDAWERFAAMLSFGRTHDASDYERAIGAAERSLGGSPRRLFHLAVPPSAAAAVVKTIGEAGLADEDRTRVILEKPFGTDLDSARKLNASLHEILSERQIFRIDHFLGKEGVQNVITLRFANAFIEPVFDREHVDSIQIEVPEQLTIVGRAGFCEQTGCLKDMVTPHRLQVLAFTAMAPPVSLHADALRDRTGDVFQAL